MARYETGDALPYEWSGDVKPISFGFVEEGAVALIDDGILQLFAVKIKDGWAIGYDRDGTPIKLGLTKDELERIKIVEVFERRGQVEELERQNAILKNAADASYEQTSSLRRRLNTARQ